MRGSTFKTVFALIAAVGALSAAAIDIDDLLNPDAAILKQKTKSAEQQKPIAESKPVEETPAKPAVQPVDVQKEREAQRRLEEERERQKAELKRVQDELRRQREAAAAKEAAAREDRAKADEASRKELEAERRELAKQREALEALETKLKSSEAARKAAERKAEEAETARQKSEAEIGDVAKKALAERQAREQAEAARRAAEQRAENERRAAEKAVAEKEAAEKVAAEKTAAEKAAAKKASEEKAAAEKAAADKDKKKKSATGREAVITAERTDYDRKEGVILFDRNVYVDDEQYQMHADRLFVFLDGTNELKRLVAIGHVAITNDEKTAFCARATYSKATGKIVMYSNEEIKARLHEGGKKGSTVVGDRITFWINSEQVEVDNPVISMPGGAMKGGDAKGFLNGGFIGGEKPKTEKEKKNDAAQKDKTQKGAVQTDAKPNAEETKGGEV